MFFIDERTGKEYNVPRENAFIAIGKADAKSYQKKGKGYEKNF